MLLRNQKKGVFVSLFFKIQAKIVTYVLTYSTLYLIPIFYHLSFSFFPNSKFAIRNIFLLASSLTGMAGWPQQRMKKGLLCFSYVYKCLKGFILASGYWLLDSIFI